MTFSNRTGVCLQSGVHVTHFLPSSLAQRYVSGVIQTSLELTFTVIYDAELDIPKQNWDFVCRVEYTWLTSSLPLLHRDMCPG
jgi:hypothetical protein